MSSGVFAGAKFSERYRIKGWLLSTSHLRRLEKTRPVNKDDSEIPLDERGQRTRTPLQRLFIDFFPHHFLFLPPCNLCEYILIVEGGLKVHHS